MVRGEDVAEGPALLVQRGKQLLGVGRIDGGGRPVAAIVQQHAVIVAPRRILVHFEALTSLLRRSFAANR